MRISTKGDYATRALLDLAMHQVSGPASVRDISERTSLPQAYLEQIMLALKAAGLVRSKRGVRGGYLLARPPGEITLAEIVEATEGQMAPLGCAEIDPDQSCVEEGNCALQLVWVKVRRVVSDILGGVTLADVAGETQTMRTPSGLRPDSGRVPVPLVSQTPN